MQSQQLIRFLPNEGLKKMISAFGVHLAMFLKSVDKQTIFKNTFSHVGVSEQ